MHHWFRTTNASEQKSISHYYYLEKCKCNNKRIGIPKTVWYNFKISHSILLLNLSIFPQNRKHNLPPPWILRDLCFEPKPFMHHFFRHWMEWASMWNREISLVHRHIPTLVSCTLLMVNLYSNLLRSNHTMTCDSYYGFLLSENSLIQLFWFMILYIHGHFTSHCFGKRSKP